MNFLNPGTFWLEWFGSGSDPIDIFENLTPLELKKLYQKINNSNLYLVGFLSYEWGAALEGIAPANASDELKLPLSWFGLYDKTTLKKAGGGGDVSLWKGNVPLTATQTFRSSFIKEDYLRAVRKILAYLKAGDCYQVNLTQRFQGEVPQRHRGRSPWVGERPLTGNVPVSAWEIYQRLREISPAPYAGFLHCGDFQILSSSPECFLEAKADGTLITKPIKGTRKRGQTLEEDEAIKKELENNPKDKAELLMITDLERNDLGKVCVPGSVRVPQLQTTQSYAQVHHLVSTVIGQRRKDLDIIDCLVAMMPGGSITGAPKIRAMEIIRELEPVNRGVYTGAIGWIGPQNTAHFNIAIRTIVLQNKTAIFSAGGGIVIDSEPELEYEESLIKTSGMMRALKI